MQKHSDQLFFNLLHVARYSCNFCTYVFYDIAENTIGLCGMVAKSENIAVK